MKCIPALLLCIGAMPTIVLGGCGRVGQQPPLPTADQLSEADRAAEAASQKQEPETSHHPVSATTPPLATADQLSEADRAAEAASQRLLADLRSSKGNAPFLAGKNLLRLRPLPASAVPVLISCLDDPAKEVGGRAATVLAYHHRDIQKVLPAIQAARKREQDQQVQRQMDCAIEHLKAVGEQLPVLADSAEVTELLEASLATLTKTRERTFRRITGTDYVYSSDGTRKAVTTAYYRPMVKDLPDRAAIAAPGTKCTATIGWHWEVQVKDNGATARRPDAAVIGPSAGELFQPLAEAAKSASSDYSGQAIIARCSLAFREIGDRKAIPLLKELRKRIKQNNAYADAVDAAIAALEK